MKWTNEKPVVAGWYWRRGYENDFPTIVMLADLGSGLRAMRPGGVYSTDWSLLNIDLHEGDHWAGPIPRPEEP